jgi:hypothetical protein
MDGLMYNYHFIYDEKDDSFYGSVTGIGGLIVYEIMDTEQLIKIIKTGEMEHIDDVEGLASMLIHDHILPPNSKIKNEGVL